MGLLMLTIEYFEILKRAHNHPKQNKPQFTLDEKIQILWRFATQLKSGLIFNKLYGLPYDSVNIFNKLLKSGDLGNHEDLTQALKDRLFKVRSDIGRLGGVESKLKQYLKAHKTTS